MIDTVISILLVEDDDVAAESVMRSLTRGGKNFPVVWAQDGVAALAVLRGQGNRPPLQRPRIILLDLNMPRMNGFEFLTVLRNDESLKEEVVFVLTTSDSDMDRMRAYQAGIAGYIVKSLIGSQYFRLAGMLHSYCDVVNLPGAQA
jgi:CheY-like chemotaxis protein